MCGCIYPSGDAVCPTCGSSRDKQVFRAFWRLLYGAAAAFGIGLVGMVLTLAFSPDRTPFGSILLVLLSVPLLLASFIAMIVGLVKKHAAPKTPRMTPDEIRLARAQRMEEIRLARLRDHTPVSAVILSQGESRAEWERMSMRPYLGALVGGKTGLALSTAAAKRKLRKMERQVTFGVTYESGRTAAETEAIGTPRFEELMQLVTE